MTLKQTTNRPTGMTAFIVIWVGQILSLLGTAVGQFGLTLWSFDASGGLATPLTLIGFFFMVPMIVFTPVVGVLVDRANRKLMMMLSDLAAAFATLLVLFLYLSGRLQIWHLYITAFITGTFQGFQWPAYSAAISTMLDKKHYTRANAMLETAGSASGILAPMIAGALIGPLGIVVRNTFNPAFVAKLSGQPGLLGLLIIDLVSASFAIGSLLFVHIPQPEHTETGQQARGNFIQEAVFGFKYIFKQPSLLGLQIVFLIGNFFSSLGFSIFAPMILARTGSDELAFGSVQTAAAIGGVVGGLAIGAWGGFKRRVHGVLLGWTLSGAGMIALGLSQALPGWLVAGFFTSMLVPLINGSNQAIWQAKVPPDIQGRVFASRRLIAWLVTPLSQLVAGPLADRVLGPAMQESGVLAPALGWLTGIGPGAGMGLQFALTGFFALLVGLGGYLFPVIRYAEDLLPDHDSAPAAETIAAD
jgi:DHA3 family macrolide efflux protein-like MFS transporter